MNKAFLCCLASAMAVAHSSAQLYSDNFDTDTSGTWNLFEGSGSGVSDYTAEFAFDYSTLSIPAAPHSAGTTRGLRLTVNNNDQVAETAAVSLYPAGQSFAGDYALKVDMWMNYNGGAFGGTGSTEFGTFGLNHTGDKVNWSAGPDSDGVWFGVTGEGGTVRDYRAYVGDPGLTPVELLDVDGGFLDRDGDGTGDVNSNDVSTNGLAFVFPVPPFETPGAPGKQWVEVEVRQQGGMVTWLMNGFVIAEHSNLNLFTSGNIMIGYMDIFSSIADPAAENFILFDNVRVEDLSGASAKPVVSIEATDVTATESGGDTGAFLITRAGDSSGPLTIMLRAGGTAIAGSDYTALPASVTLPAGVSSSNVVVTPLNDSLGESDETITLSFLASTNYEVREDVFGLVTLHDDGDVPMVNLAVLRPAAYESIPSRLARFQVRFSNPNDTDTTVQYQIGGTAVNGTDYVMIPGTRLLPGGIITAPIDIVPIDNALLDGVRTVEITLVAGSGYTLGSNLVRSVIIRNDDLPAGTVAFSEDFETDTSGAWTVNAAHPNNHATFAYNYSAVGIPPAPHTTGGTTKGLKLEANTPDGSPTTTGLSVSPNSQSFAGDYRLRFDMWINYNGPLNGGGTGSTFVQSAGAGTSGTIPQWAGGTQDSVWFGATGDGGSSVDYRAYSAAAGTGYTPASGVFAAGTAADARNASFPYYAEFGRESAPEAQLGIDAGQTGVTDVGVAGMVWRDVVITKMGNTISYVIDGLPIATVDASALTLGGNIFVGFFDINSSQTANPAMSFGLVDNLRVETLATAPVILAARAAGDMFEIDFSGAAADAPDAFKVDASDTVDGTYQEVAATVIQLSPGQFRATVALAGGMRFFLVRR